MIIFVAATLLTIRSRSGRHDAGRWTGQDYFVNAALVNEETESA